MSYGSGEDVKVTFACPFGGIRVAVVACPKLPDTPNDVQEFILKPFLTSDSSVRLLSRPFVPVVGQLGPLDSVPSDLEHEQK